MRHLCCTVNRKAKTFGTSASALDTRDSGTFPIKLLICSIVTPVAAEPMNVSSSDCRAVMSKLGEEFGSIFSVERLSNTIAMNFMLQRCMTVA